MANIKQSDGHAQRDYDFVEQPNEDFHCPVILDILLQPHQTDCCGQHISQQAVDRLTREGKACPMCKTDRLLTHEDKFFKRIVKKLKVRCPLKKSGCVWEGELGNLDSHSESCLKRPWKCQHCNLETTYEEGTNDHTPKCPMYPEPCPNCCDIGTVPRCDVEKHLLVCPMELVMCDFAHAGCDVQIPRRDLAKHLSENAQQHLMSATLLNLRLTRELHQKMEEKDQQIVHLQQQTRDLDTKLQQQTSQLTRCSSEIKMLIGFTQHDFILHKFNEQQEKGRNGSWYSDPFYNYPGGYRFLLNIDTNGYSEAHGTHLSAFFILQPGDNDHELKWPMKCELHLEILNQQGDHGHYRHYRVIRIREYYAESDSESEAEDDEKDVEARHIETTNKFFPLSKLGHNVAENIQYLKNDCLQFRLFLKVSCE